VAYIHRLYTDVSSQACPPRPEAETLPACGAKRRARAAALPARPQLGPRCKRRTAPGISVFTLSFTGVQGCETGWIGCLQAVPSFGQFEKMADVDASAVKKAFKQRKEYILNNLE
jgi:hypothetical protein